MDPSNPYQNPLNTQQTINNQNPIIDDSAILNQGSQFTLDENQTMQMSSYLTECHNQGKLNENQYQFYLNQLWDQDTDFENNMKDLNLWEGFLQYQNNQTQQTQQNEKMIKDQKTNLQEKIQTIREHLAAKTTQIGLFKKEIEELNTPTFQNNRQRYEQYPDNLRLKAEVQPTLNKIDELETQILLYQEEINNLQTELFLWEGQLQDLE